MSFAWYDAAPFGFSIAVKLLGRFFDDSFTKKFTKDIPRGYNLDKNQETTLATSALDGSLRISTIISINLTTISAAALTYMHNAKGLGIFLTFLFAILNVSVFALFTSKHLGWFYVPHRGGQKWKRADTMTAGLIVLDILLCLLTWTAAANDPTS